MEKMETSKIKCRVNFVETSISSAFTSLGTSVGRYPLLYCLLPILVTAVFSTGFCWLEQINDLECLFSPVNGRALRERAAVEKLFPPSNYTADVLTVTRFKGMAAIILLPKDHSSVLRDDIMEDATILDRIIQNISVSWKNKTIRWGEICPRTALGICMQNDILHLRDKLEDVKRGRLCISVSTSYVGVWKHSSTAAFGLGGVTADENGCTVNASALRLFYLLDYTTAEKEEISSKWVEKFLETTGKITLRNVRILRGSDKSTNDESNQLTKLCLPYFGILIPLMGTFAVLSSMTTDCTTSKPLVAIAGCMSPVFGVLSAFGLLMMMGVPYIDVNIAIPLLLTGIGLDDSFVLLAAWRRTDPNVGVEKRMSLSFSEAGPSITITSITNLLSVCAGLASPYMIIRTYCKYTSLSIVFSYIYQITFFGSALALSGIREKKGLHSVLFVPVREDKVLDFSISRLLYFGCNKGTTGRTNAIRPKNSTYSLYLLSLLLSKGGKAAVLGCFMLYLASSIYGLTLIKTKDGTYIREAMPQHSYMRNFLEAHYEYFTQYPHPVQIVINKTLDYSSKEVQDNIEKMLCEFCEEMNTDEAGCSISWLKYYLQSVSDRRLWFAYYGYNISNGDDFLVALSEVFLKFPNAVTMRQNIRFNENKTKIVSSRFFVISKNVHSNADEQRLLSYVWSKADSAVYPAYVHNHWFPIYDYSMEVYSSFKLTLLVTTGLITITFIIFIPNVLCIVCISVTSFSIQCGVIGYMTLWNTPVSVISTICIIMSVGLSIDYSAHVSYAYLSSGEVSPDKKTRVALFAAGYPIIQGCVTTWLGVAVIAFIPSDVLLMFFKVITLVMAISLLFGLIFIPTLLNVLDSTWGWLNEYLLAKR